MNEQLANIARQMADMRHPLDRGTDPQWVKDQLKRQHNLARINREDQLLASDR